LRDCRATDLFNLGSQRVVDEDGYLTAPGVIAKAGNVQEYRASELGLDGDPNRIVKLYRPREEVAKSAPTFAKKPVTNGHPREKWVNADNWEKYAIGDSGASVDMQGDDMVTLLTIRKRRAVDEIMSGKSGLSNGYLFSLDDDKKTTPEGIAVDGWMTNIRGNHIAIVKRGRGGPECTLADEERNGAMSTRQEKIGKLTFELDVTAADAVAAEREEKDKLAADCKAAETMAEESEKRAVTAEAACKEHLAKIAALDAEIVELKKNPPAPSVEVQQKLAEERLAVIGDAAVLAADVKPEGKTIDTIRREALTAASAKHDQIKKVADSILHGMEVAKAASEAIEAAFVASVSVLRASKTRAVDSGLGAALLGAGLGGDADKPKDKEDKSTAANDSDGLTGRALYVHRLNHRPVAKA
jgi:uncharacterized protein